MWKIKSYKSSSLHGLRFKACAEPGKSFLGCIALFIKKSVAIFCQNIDNFSFSFYALSKLI